MMNKKENDVTKNSILLVFFMLLTNIFTYLFQIVIGRMLTVEEFGTINTLLSLTVIIGVPIGTLQMQISKEAAECWAAGDDDRMTIVLKSFLKFTFLVGMVILVLGMVFEKGIAYRLGIDNWKYIFLVLVITVVGCVSPILSGALQGLERFIPYSFISIIIAVFKFAFSVILIYLGWRIYGVLFAIIFSSLIALGYGVYSLKDIIFRETTGKYKIDIKNIFCVFKEILIMQILVTLLTNGDVIVIKYFIKNDTVAGLYSSGAVLAKVPLYVAIAVLTAFFPRLVQRYTLNERIDKLLIKLFLGVCGVAIVGLVAVNTVGRMFIPLLFGDKYTGVFPFLSYICIYSFALTLITIEENIALAINRTKVFRYTLFLGILGAFVFVCFGENTIESLLFKISFFILLVGLANMVDIFVWCRRR